MTRTDDLRETIRALEIKAGVQRGHLQTTENELARLKRELNKLTEKRLITSL